MEIPQKEMLLTHVATDFSNLPTVHRYGPEVMYANIKWRIGYRKEEDMVGVYLFCNEAKTDKIWSVTANFSIRVLSVDGEHWSKDCRFIFANDAEFSGSGGDFDFEDLLDYAVDDTLVFEIKMTIEAITGIDKPQKKRSFERSSEEPFDLVLKVEDQKFHVTKGYLLAQSEYFKNLLMGKFKERKQKVVELKDIDPDVFQVFLELVYIEDALTDDNIEDVMELVDMYDAKNVARLCEQYLMHESKLSTRTKFQLAAKFKFEKLKKHSVKSLKSLADVRAVMALDSSHLDASTCHVLLERMIRLK